MFRTKLTYFENLDGLRGLAAFSVLVFHFFLSPKVTSSLTDIELVKKITEILQHGVTLFFVLSGFVITRILLNNRTETNYFSKFYKTKYQLYTTLQHFFFSNATQLYKTLQIFTQFDKTLHNCIKLYKTLQNSAKLFTNLSKLYNTIRNS
jgi:hypothetical protein